MTKLSFEWDSKKNAANISKHGVSFAEAEAAFADEFARLIPDPDHSSTEDRFVLLGLSIRSRLLVVCHCLRSNDTIRIISARNANKRECQSYEGFSDAY